MKILKRLFCLVVCLLSVGCWNASLAQDSAKGSAGKTNPSTNQEESEKGARTDKVQEKQSAEKQEEKKMETATLANGCFWCTEAVFEQLKGVESATSGYTGGTVENPSYQAVCTGRTGHAECLQIVYDPEVISFAQLLAVFFTSHDPTTLNRQGPDYGTQYRSGIFYHNDEQKRLAEQYIAQLNEAEVFDDPIVTEVAEFKKFFPAEDYHQEYFATNPNDRYCRTQALPKMKKVKKVFEDLIKEDAGKNK